MGGGRSDEGRPHAVVRLGPAGTTAGPSDLLGEDRPVRRRLPGCRWVVGLAVVAVLLAGLDGVARRREAAALVDRVEAGQATGVYADRRLAGTVQYAGSALTSSTAPPAVRADLRDLVRGEAAGRLPSLRVRRAAVAGVDLLPWHGDARRARAAYLAHLDARVARLEAVAGDVSSLYRPAPAVGQTARRARTALAAVTGAGEADRLDRLLGPLPTAG